MDRDDEANFARRMVEYRTALGLSQSELARKMVERGFDHYSQMTVSRTEKGERPIRLGEARVLSEILGASLQSMMRGTAQAEYVNRVRATQTSLIDAMFRVALALFDYEELVDDIDEHKLFLSMLDDDDDGDAREAWSHLNELRFPAKAVAMWAAEVEGAVRDASRDISAPELTYADVERMRELAVEYGERQAPSER